MKVKRVVSTPDHSVEFTILINATRMTRNEVRVVADELASAAMRAIAAAPYLNVPISKVRVRP